MLYNNFSLFKNPSHMHYYQYINIWPHFGRAVPRRALKNIISQVQLFMPATIRLVCDCIWKDFYRWNSNEFCSKSWTGVYKFRFAMIWMTSDWSTEGGVGWIPNFWACGLQILSEKCHWHQHFSQQKIRFLNWKMKVQK